MRNTQFYLSTTAEDAAPVAREFGLGIEIAEFCTAWNMDDCFAQTDANVKDKIRGVSRRLFHAPFNELFPCAIDPKARELAVSRYRQAITLAKQYGAEKIVIHGGYDPHLYFPNWYADESITFWKDFLKEYADLPIVLENVLEEEPEMLLEIVKGVDHPNLRLCLDAGHANTYSHVPVLDWVHRCAPYLQHFHIHNNDGSRDSHSHLAEGNIPIKELLLCASSCCPDASYTLELSQARSSVQWLQDHIF